MKTYKNPFLFENQWSEYECGDPFILRFDGMYYLYCSSAGDHIKCWSSENLVDFKYEGSVCDDPVIDGAYAPEVSYYKGRFYMITSPVGSGHYLLEAENPTGPFRIISDNFGLLIDGSLFTDDDGKRYMLRAGHKGIVIHNMPSPGEIEVNGTTIPEAYLNYWTEGPMIIKRNGLYYLTYTGNHLLSKGYRVAYSVSDKAPDHGYVSLKNRTLLLETRTEFHALGHSSSFLAPDLDSYCIAYHSFDLDGNPHRRSTCIDRLFFNGARMYCNPIWWEQTAHRMPDFSCRGDYGLQEVSLEGKQYYVTPVKTADHYTAELNVRPEGGRVELIYGRKDGQYGTIRMEDNQNYLVLEAGDVKAVGKINDAVSFHGNLTIRFTKRTDGDMEIYINNLFLCSFQSGLGEGFFGILKNDKQKVGFIGFSGCTEGSEDKFAYKAVPGRFDAVHCLEEIEKIAFKDAGLTVYAGCLKEGERYTYIANVSKTGYYKLLARTKQTTDRFELKVSSDMEDKIFIGHLSGICDEEGYETVTVGTVYLTAGIQQIVLEASEQTLIIDYFEFIENSDGISCEVIKDGHLVTDCMQILGHKRQKSLIHKYSGFTCAENHGIGFVGETGMGDYKVSSVINMNSNNTGDVSVYIRASKESWFGAQVKEAFFGYRILVTNDGIYLYRESYEERLLAFYSFQGIGISELNLDIEAVQSKIVISVNTKTVIAFVDPTPYLYGKIGMEVTGEGFGFEHFSIKGNE